MSVEKAIICDGCGALMGAGRAVADARRDARDSVFNGRRFGRRDFCADCRKLGKHEEK